MLQEELQREIGPETEFTGTLLRKVRESQGLELAEISAKTKIGRAHLQALEEERFEDLHFPSPQPLGARTFEERHAVMTAQLLVVLSLRAFELAENGLLGFLGELAGHLLLGPPQDERAKRL